MVIIQSDDFLRAHPVLGPITKRSSFIETRPRKSRNWSRSCRLTVESKDLDHAKAQHSIDPSPPNNFAEFLDRIGYAPNGIGALEHPGPFDAADRILIEFHGAPQDNSRNAELGQCKQIIAGRGQVTELPP
jgi:hypothetical protein